MPPLVSAIIFLIVVPLIIGLLFMSKGRRHARAQKELKRQFFEKEQAANAMRKKELEPELFYTADLSVLPPVPADDPHQVERGARRTMIRLPQPITNLELKQKYGVAQMDVIAQYEENFNEYLKALTSWAEALAPESPSDALVILRHAISLGAEFRSTYKLAADIFAAQGKAESLEALLDAAGRNHFRDPVVRQHILEHINRKLDEIS